MAESKQKQIDQQLLCQLDSLRNSGVLNLGETNWYNARRPAIGTVQPSGGTATVVELARPLSRLERKTIEKILTAHGVSETTA